ncbi:MAG TPA: Hsp20/alpha crystallin family protein [Methanobacterium sp.]|nr:MAG: Hsp20/alpha crystallin family protein [Methanobacterium sp.]HOI71167.1 Hsp20/alpha crystallin family protein [Methanobacterium sp.]
MAKDVVESKEEMKRNMEGIKKDEEKKDLKKKTELKLDKTKQKLGEEKEKTQEKLGETKEKTQEKLGETKEKLGEEKEKTQEKLGDVKEESKEKWGEAKENLRDVKDEATFKFEEYLRESEKEGKNPAEKFLSDIISGFVQKTEDVNQAMAERTGTLTTIPLADVIETDNSITVIIDIPGLSKEDMDLGISKDNIEITINYDKKPPLTSGKFIQKERGYGTVHRTINLPTFIDVKKASASYKNSILTITLPKKQKQMTKITIE